MKKFILSLTLIITSLTTFAQAENITDSVQKQLKDVENAAAKGDFRKGVKSCTEMLALSESSSLTQAQSTELKSTAYYNMACFYSMAQMEEPAVNAFKNAIENGFINYDKAKKDKDLSYIRHHDTFVELMKQLHKNIK
ncbi:MAG: hypothetical protein PHD21_02705 [Flavobacteriales bacterium]|nr:hypothetical protein [Flavobacteriales bacterium]